MQSVLIKMQFKPMYIWKRQSKLKSHSGHKHDVQCNIPQPSLQNQVLPIGKDKLLGPCKLNSLVTDLIDAVKLLLIPSYNINANYISLEKKNRKQPTRDSFENFILGKLPPECQRLFYDKPELYREDEFDTYVQLDPGFIELDQYVLKQEKLIQTLNGLLKDATEKGLDLQKVIDNLKSELDALSQLKQEQEGTLANQVLAVQRLQEDELKIKASFALERQEFEQKIASLSSNLAALIEDLEKTKIENSRLLSERDAEHQKCLSFQAQLNLTNSENTILKQQSQIQKDDREKMIDKEEYANLLKDHNLLNDQFKEVVQERDSLKEKLKLLERPESRRVSNQLDQSSSQYYSANSDFHNKSSKSINLSQNSGPIEQNMSCQNQRKSLNNKENLNQLKASQSNNHSSHIPNGMQSAEEEKSSHRLGNNQQVFQQRQINLQHDSNLRSSNKEEFSHQIADRAIDRYHQGISIHKQRSSEREFNYQIKSGQQNQFGGTRSFGNDMSSSGRMSQANDIQAIVSSSKMLSRDVQQQAKPDSQLSSNSNPAISQGKQINPFQRDQMVGPSMFTPGSNLMNCQYGPNQNNVEELKQSKQVQRELNSSESLEQSIWKKNGIQSANFSTPVQGNLNQFPSSIHSNSSIVHQNSNAIQFGQQMSNQMVGQNAFGSQNSSDIQSQNDVRKLSKRFGGLNLMSNQKYNNNVNEDIDGVDQRVGDQEQNSVPHVQQAQPHVQMSEPRVQLSEPHVQLSEPHVQQAQPHVQQAQPQFQQAQPRVQMSEPPAQKSEPIVENSEPLAQKNNKKRKRNSFEGKND
eukprot:403346514